MKNLPSLLIIVITCAVVLILQSIGLPRMQPAATPVIAAPTAASTTNDPSACSSARSVQVSGSAVINVVPDRALIQLGVQSNGVTTQSVEEINTNTTAAVIRAVRQLGIEAKDIATDHYIIEPIYDNYSSLYIKGYRINNTVGITLRDVSKSSAVIAAALQAGANQVINVDFYTSELRKYRDQARDLAMKAAKEKAQALASSAEAEAGCVLTINENSWSYYNGWWYGRSQNASQMTQNVIQNAAPSGSQASGSSDEPISLGQVSVKAEINASFALK